jgi:hypothetical protein
MRNISWHKRTLKLLVQTLMCSPRPNETTCFTLCLSTLATDTDFSLLSDDCFLLLVEWSLVAFRLGHGVGSRIPSLFLLLGPSRGRRLRARLIDCCRLGMRPCRKVEVTDLNSKCNIIGLDVRLCKVIATIRFILRIRST